jgi:cytochrome c-type biogenesis protein CcmH
MNAQRLFPLRVLHIAYCVLLLAIGCPLSAIGLAQNAAPPPDLSSRVFDIARELRCPVCQGESAAESNADISVEMRRIIAEQLAQGKSSEQIKAYFVQRYGDWILYDPPRRGATLWVWLSPVLGLIALGLVLWRYQAIVKQRARTVSGDVSDEEIARLEAQLRQTPDAKR